MPRVFEINGYKFYFYSNEGNELPHIHVRKGNGMAKYWLKPDLEEEYAYGFTVRERRDIRNILYDNHQFLIKKWYENFKENRK